MAKKKTDNLAREAMLAKQAGMSYGRWKATQEIVVPKRKNERICPNCGNKFVSTSKKYCDSICGLQYRNKMYEMRKAEGVLDGK